MHVIHICSNVTYHSSQEILSLLLVNLLGKNIKFSEEVKDIISIYKTITFNTCTYNYYLVTSVNGTVVNKSLLIEAFHCTCY